MTQTTRPSFNAVTEFLRDLVKEKGIASVLEFVTEALGPMIESEKTHGLEPRRGGIRKLWGGKDILLAAPGEEHGQLFSKDGQFTLFVAQPYVVDLKTMKEIVLFCQEYGLTATISGRSSYFVGRAVRLEYRRTDGDVTGEWK
jgi:hypothetical protein